LNAFNLYINILCNSYVQCNPFVN